MIKFEFPTEKQREDFFQLKEVKEILQKTEDENRAISRYQGTGALQINELMGNFISDRAIITDDKGYYTSKNHNNMENIKEIINTIQNIYSVMLKKHISSELSGEHKVGRHLYRGATKPLNPENNSFISTTTNMNEALLFATSNNKSAREHYLIDIYADKDVMCIYMPHSGNEDEILISPFVKVVSKSRERGEKWGTPIIREMVSVEPMEPRECSDEEMQRIETDLLEKADEISELIPECVNLQRSIRGLLEDIDFTMERKRNTLGKLSGSPDYKETKEYFEQKIESLERERAAKIQELEQKSIRITEWKNQFRILVEGKCSKLEKNLYNRINQVREAKRMEQEERRRKEADEFAKMKQEEERKKENSRQIKLKLEQAKREAETVLSSAKNMRNIMKNTGIQYDSQIEYTLSIIRSISYRPETSRDMAMNSVLQIGNLPQNLSRTQSELLAMEDENFKRALDRRIMEIRLIQEQRIAHQDLQNKKTEKIGVLGKVSGRAKKQEEDIKAKSEEIEKIQILLSLIKVKDFSMQVKYSVHEMLADIEFAKIKGALSNEELKEMERYKIAIESLYAPFVREGKRIVPIDEVRLKRELDKRIQEDGKGERLDALLTRIGMKVSRETRQPRRIASAARVSKEVRNMIETIEKVEINNNNKGQEKYGVER